MHYYRFLRLILKKKHYCVVLVIDDIRIKFNCFFMIISKKEKFINRGYLSLLLFLVLIELDFFNLTQVEMNEYI